MKAEDLAWLKGEIAALALAIAVIERESKGGTASAVTWSPSWVRACEDRLTRAIRCLRGGKPLL